MIKATRTVEIKLTFNGTELAAEREQAGMTQAELAKRSGICQQRISQLERPHPVTIRGETIDALARAGIFFAGEPEVIWGEPLRQSTVSGGV